MRRLLLAVLVLAASGCRSGLPRPTFERFDLAATPGPESFPDAPAAVLLDRGEIQLTVEPKTGNPIARLRRLRRVKILRETGLDRARIVVPYEPGTAIHGLAARVTRPDGEVILADPENMADSPFEGEVRAKTLFVPGAEVGAVVETVYDQYVQDPRFLAPWTFQSDIPTVRSELAVIVPAPYTVDLRFSEDGAFVRRPPERFETAQGTRFSWSLAGLPPLYDEPRMPSEGLLAPRAHVVFLEGEVRGRTHTGFRSWDELAGWFVRRRPDYADVSAETAAEAARVAGDAPDLEKALKIMEVLARDLPDAPGPRPPLWRAPLPHPDAVLRMQRANPTSRGLLFVALLRSVGLDAVPGLFVYRDEDVILPDLPTVRALDGVAAVLPSPTGPVILDPSQPLVSATVPATRLQGTRMVALMPDGARVIRVPEGEPEASMSEIRYDLRLDERGGAYGPLKARFTGAEAAALRAALFGAPPEAYADRVSAFLAARGVPFDVDTVSIADLEALRRPLSLTANLDLPAFVEGEGTALPLSLAKLVGGQDAAPPETRRAPLLLGAPAQVELRATLTVPETWEVGEVPSPATVEWDGGRVEIVPRAETRRRLGLVRTETRTAYRVAPEDWRAYRRFREQVEIAEDQSALVERPAPRSFEY